MAQVELVEDRIVIHAPRVQKDLVRQVPGARYSADQWTAPLSWGVCQALRGIFGDDLEIGEELQTWAWDVRETRIDPVLSAREADDAKGDERLRPFQRAVVWFGELAGSFINASEMGTGKTVETLMTDLPWPILVVCNNTMKRTWAVEFARWRPDARVIVVANGTAKGRRSLAEDADAYVVNWEALRTHSRLAPYGSLRLTRCRACGGADDSVTEARCETHVKPLNRPWGTVIADEAHRSKDPKAKQTRALWAIGSEAEETVALTGTPVVNTPADLWSILHFIAPEDWPARTAFIDRYCMLGMGWGGSVEVIGLRPDTRDEFYQILDPRYKRDLKQDVLPQLPAKTYTLRVVDMAPKQAKAYAQMRDQMLAELDDGVLVTTNALAKATRLTQFACSYAELGEAGLELVEPSCKADALEELVFELGGRAAVVFAESRKLIELASRRLTKRKLEHVLVTGAVTGSDRDAAVSRFQAGDVQLLLATLGAGGESITLTAADTAIFLQRSWSLVKNVQAEDRIHRIGQEADKIEIIDVVAAGTIEEHRMLTLEEKAERVREVTRDPVAFRAALEFGR